MFLREIHILSNNLRTVKATLESYPDIINMEQEYMQGNTYPLMNAMESNYPTNIIRFLLKHGANPNQTVSTAQWYYHSTPIITNPLKMALNCKNWLWMRLLIHHGAKITPTVEIAYKTAPSKEKKWFIDWTTHRQQFSILIPELIERSAYSYHVPPIEVKPGITIPGRQGFQDTQTHWLESRAGTGSHAI